MTGTDPAGTDPAGTDPAGTDPAGTDPHRVSAEQAGHGSGSTRGRSAAPDPAPPARPRPYDPEKGLRGVMSATLILEAITVLLAIPVAANTGSGVGPFGVAVISLLAVLLIATCGIISRPSALQVILGLQAVMIACWFITPPLGIMGIIFALVWATILWFRGEFRRRLAAGTLPGPPQPSGR